jgi:hypothetical protein
LPYTPGLDGRRQATPTGALQLRLDPRVLGSGRHRVQLLATDGDSQATLSVPSSLAIAGVPPRVRVTRARGGAAVSVRVLDPYAGVDARAVSVSFGDGVRAHGRARFLQRYAHAGIYRVTVRVRDRIGNRGVVRRLVSVR